MSFSISDLFGRLRSRISRAPSARPGHPQLEAASRGAPTVALRVLGTVDIRSFGASGEGSDTPISQPKRLALLAVLALSGSREWVRRDQLLGIFWPEMDEVRARHALSQSLYVLRNELGTDVLRTEGRENVGIDPSTLWCDGERFEREMEAGNLESALDLYRGPLLPHFYVEGCGSFDEWMERERARLEALAASAARDLAEEAEARGDLQDAIRWRERHLDFVPYDESALVDLLDVLERVGDRNGALLRFQEFSERLRRDLELEPSTELRERVERLRSDPHPARYDVGDGPAIPNTGRGIVRGGKAWLAAATLAALLLSGALALSSLTEPPARVVRFELTLPQDLHYDRGGGVNLDFSPDGSTIVFRGRVGSQTSLWERPLDRLSPRPIPGTEDAHNPRFSPDGRAVVFTAAGRLVRVSLTGEPPWTLVGDSVRDAAGGVAWSDDGHIYFTRTDGRIWRIPEGGGIPEPVAESSDSGGQWLDALPDGRGLVYTRDMGSRQLDQIEVLDLRTGASRSLVQGATARYSRTGHLVYVTGDGTLTAAPFDTRRLEVTGPGRGLLQGVQVNNGSASQFALSAAGLLAYEPATALYPVWVDRSGGSALIDPGLDLRQGPLALSPDGGRLAQGVAQGVISGFISPPEALALSPDGGRLALSLEDGSAVWVKKLPEGPLTRLSVRATIAYRPVWTRDGERVVLIAADSGNFRALMLRADGSSLAPDTIMSTERDVWEVLPPDPEGRILFRYRDFTVNADVGYIERVGDSIVHPLLDSPYSEHAIMRSPDGRWLAYVSDISGRREVYVRPFPEIGNRRIQISTEGGTEPVWSPTGDEIFYRDAEGWLVAAGVRTAPDLGIASRTRLFDASVYRADRSFRLYDVSPDGQRFLMLKLGLNQPQLVVVDDWVRQLEAP